MTIDWNDEKSLISRYFTVREALWLPTWGRLATEADGLTDRIKGEIEFFAQEVMDVLRGALAAPILVHCWFRPPAYNALIGGAPKSPHMSTGHWSACDFHLAGFGTTEGCADTREWIMPYLAPLGIRMEDIVGPWVHCDSMPPLSGQPRFFPVGVKK